MDYSRMLRLIIQTERKDKKYKEDLNGKDIQNEGMSEDAQEEDSTNDEYDQDSQYLILKRMGIAHQAKKINWKSGLST